VHVARMQVASAVQLVLQITRFSDGSRRVQAISELVKLDDQNMYQFVDLYRFRATGMGEEGRVLGTLEPTQARPTFAGEPMGLGLGGKVQLTASRFAARLGWRRARGPPATRRGPGQEGGSGPLRPTAGSATQPVVLGRAARRFGSDPSGRLGGL